tara:strand:+ start:833 stop:1360 length:528 start_codon:yes stop_codon:yes gene_type:complete
MCEPATLATIGSALTSTKGLAIASGALSTLGAIQGANAQADAYKANAEMANRAKMDEERMINLRQSQEQEKAAQQKIAQDLETQQITARAQATDSGLTLNNNAVIQDIVRQGLVANNMTTQNLERTTAQLGEDRRGAATKAQSRINSVARPSRTATGLQIGSGLLSSATDYKAMT